MKRFISFFTSELGRIVFGFLFFVTALAVDFFTENSYISLTFYVSALLVAGFPVFLRAIRGIFRRDLLDENFLMLIASIGAMILGERSEGVAVMLFFLVGEFFEHKAVGKSRKSIRALMDIRPDEACVTRDGKEEIMDADEVEVGSVIVIRAGDRVPIDSVVISGTADIDTSAITGESIPRAVKCGSRLDSGVVVINGVLFAKTLCLADESAASRILELVENANERKSRTENFITAFARIYTPVVVALALCLAVIPSLIGITAWGESVYRALVFLVISCPCALVISVPMAFFGGIGGAAAKGILYKGGSTFSHLAAADSFVFDKTGTLTAGEFTVTDSYAVDGNKKRLLYLAASAEHFSAHPVALCIKNSSTDFAIPKEVRELAGKGISAIVDGSQILVGNRLLLEEHGVILDGVNAPIGSILVAEKFRFIGYIVIADKVKPEASESLKALRLLGAKRLVILSGDRRESAIAVASQVGIDEAYSELLPENKFEKLEEIIDLSRATVFVGDGINDAPAIARADVGVAMGGIGSDSAIEAADLVITSDNLEKLPLAVKIARKTLGIAKENIIFALGVKGAVLVLGALGLANMWLAVFADVGVAALAILNSMRTLVVRE